MNANSFDLLFSAFTAENALKISACFRFDCMITGTCAAQLVTALV